MWRANILRVVSYHVIPCEAKLILAIFKYPGSHYLHFYSNKINAPDDIFSIYLLNSIHHYLTAIEKDSKQLGDILLFDTL